MNSLPTGIITFLFTDVEGSTKLWEQHPELAPQVMAQHDALIEAAVEQFRGVVEPLADGPDVKAAVPVGIGRRLPAAPDSFPFVVASVEDFMLADVRLGPPALTVGEVIASPDEEQADPVVAVAPECPASEGEGEVHPVSARHDRLQEEPCPGAGREPGIGLDHGGDLVVGAAHRGPAPFGEDGSTDGKDDRTFTGQSPSQEARNLSADVADERR